MPPPDAPAPDAPPDPTPPPEVKATPDAVEIAQAVVKAMQEQPTQAKAEQAAADTIQAELHVSEEDAKRIAAATISELEARGAFEPPPAAGEPVEPVAQGEPQGGEQGGAQGGARPPDEGQPAAGEPDVEPRKKTFAERFAGR